MVGVIDDDPAALFPQKRIQNISESLFPGYSRTDPVSMGTQFIFPEFVKVTACPHRSRRRDMETSGHDFIAIHKTVVFGVGCFQHPFRKGRENIFACDKRKFLSFLFSQFVFPFFYDTVPIQGAFHKFSILQYPIFLGCTKGIFLYGRKGIIRAGGIVIGECEKIIPPFQRIIKCLKFEHVGVNMICGTDPVEFFPIHIGIRC